MTRQNDHKTPFYLRQQTGETFFVDTLGEALEAFTSDEGYRLTLNDDGHEIVIRREDFGDGPLTEHLGILEAEASVMYKPPHHQSLVDVEHVEQGKVIPLRRDP